MNEKIKELGVNVSAVLIGILFLIIAITWVEAFRSIVEEAYFDDENSGLRYKHQRQKKLLSALCVTALCGFIIIITYEIEKPYLKEKKISKW
jgi:uncharacterized BrkB/YihY/UPF0761 family membrane protein